MTSSLCFGCIVILVLLQCVTSMCITAQGCHPNITGFTGTVSTNVINCIEGNCVCNTCFVESEGSCTLREGCWELYFSGQSFECRQRNRPLFSTPSSILFGISAVTFVAPLLVAAVCGLAIVVCFRRCSKMNIPERFITPVIVVAIACFWTVTAVFLVVGIIISTMSESSDSSSCLQTA